MPTDLFQLFTWIFNSLFLCPEKVLHFELSSLSFPFISLPLAHIFLMHLHWASWGILIRIHLCSEWASEWEEELRLAYINCVGKNRKMFVLVLFYFFLLPLSLSHSLTHSLSLSHSLTLYISIHLSSFFFFFFIFILFYFTTDHWRITRVS
jgi:hypothetical protein